MIEIIELEKNICHGIKRKTGIIPDWRRLIEIDN